MNPGKTILICIGLLLLLHPVTLLANGGEKHDTSHDEAIQDPLAVDSIYSAGDEASPLDMDDPLGSPLSRSALDIDDEPMDTGTGMPMMNGMEGMDHKDMEGMDHSGNSENMPTVELAHHELVSPPQKGYNLAVAITLLSGLLYGVLILKKPGE